MKLDTLAAGGSMLTGGADFAAGNLVSFFNFAKDLRASHHARLVGNKSKQQWQAFMANDPNWANMSTEVAPHESMQAMWKDLIPFNLGERVASILSPAPRGG